MANITRLLQASNGNDRGVDLTSNPLVSLAFISASSSPATTGVNRLASGDAIAWRNNANLADLLLAKNASDQLTWPSGVLLSGAVALTASGLALNVSNNAEVGGELGVGGAPVSGAGIGITGGASSGNSQYGLYSNFTADSSTTTQSAGVYSAPKTAGASFTLPILASFWAVDVSKGATSTVTNQVGFYAPSLLSATNNATLSDSNSFTGNWFINQSGSAASLFGGNVTSSHSVSGGANSITATNTNAAASSSAQFVLNSDTGTASIVEFSSGTVASAFNKPNGLKVANTGSGGVSLVAANASGVIDFWPGNLSTTAALSIGATGIATFLSSAGSAATPGIAFSGDTTTGLWDIGSSAFGMASGGTEVARITSGQLNVTAGTDTGVTGVVRAGFTWTTAAGANGQTGARIFASNSFDGTMTAGLVGMNPTASRTITNSQSDAVSIRAVVAQTTFTVPSTKTYTNTSDVSAIFINSVPAVSGTLALTDLNKLYILADSTATGTYKNGILVGTQSGATNNAAIADNAAYSGSFFINQSTSAPSVLTGTLSVTSNIPQIKIQADTTGHAPGQYWLNAATSGHFNWMLAAQQNVNNGFEITPSTATDGTTFSTPVFSITQAGNATVTGQLGVIAASGGSDQFSVNGTATLAGTTQIGMASRLTSTSAATVRVDGFRSQVTTAASTTVAVAIGLDSQAVTVGSGGAVTRFVDVMGNASTHPATNNAFLADNTTFTGNFFINSTSTDASLISGDLTLAGSGTGLTVNNNAKVSGVLGVGATPNASQAITIANSGLTGTGQVGILNAPAFSSAATVEGDVNNSSPSTAAASFTLPLLSHYLAHNVSVGAGSTVTRQVGFYTDGLSAATNNAFAADNATFTGNWFINQSTANPSQLTGTLNGGGILRISGGASGYIGTSNSSVFSSTGTAYFASTGNVALSCNQASTATDPTTADLFISSGTTGQVTVGASGSTRTHQVNGNLSVNAAGTSGNVTVAGVIIGGNSVTGSTGSPQSITAGGGIAFTGSASKSYWFVQGSGGAVTVTANPQVAAGSTVGQELVIVGASDTNTVTLQDGTGLSLNGPITLANRSNITLFWDGTVWNEQARK